MGQEDNKISLYFSLSFRGSILLKSSREESELFSLYSSGTRNTKHKIILKVYKTVQGREIFLSKFEGGGHNVDLWGVYNNIPLLEHFISDSHKNFQYSFPSFV